MEPETTPGKIPSAVVIPGIKLLTGPWSHRLDWPDSTQHRHTCCHDKTEYNRELEFSQNLRHLFQKCRALHLFACRTLRYVDVEHMARDGLADTDREAAEEGSQEGATM